MDIAGFQKPGNAGFPMRQGAQDQGPLGNRFISRDLGDPFEGPGPAGG
jgi:hypothetical protein